MKKTRDPLDRLLQAAAQAPRPVGSEAVFTMEARVLASWRASRDTDDWALWVFWLRRAMACAFGLLLLSAVWSLTSTSHRSGDELSLADSALQIALDRP